MNDSIIIIIVEFLEKIMQKFLYMKKLFHIMITEQSEKNELMLIEKKNELGQHMMKNEILLIHKNLEIEKSFENQMKILTIL
jgi:hypothetical protein